MVHICSHHRCELRLSIKVELFLPCKSKSRMVLELEVVAVDKEISLA